VDRYSFIVVDLHHLLLAGLPAHFESFMPSHAVGVSVNLGRFWLPWKRTVELSAARPPTSASLGGRPSAMMHPRSSELLQGVDPMRSRRADRCKQRQNGDVDEYPKTQPRRENDPNAHSSLSPSVLPKPLEAIRRQLGVADRVLGTGPLFVAQKSQVEILIVVTETASRVPELRCCGGNPLFRIPQTLGPASAGPFLREQRCPQNPFGAVPLQSASLLPRWWGFH
jgi:hypothetical protein